MLPQIEEWQNRPLDDVYPVIYIDAIHYSVRDNGVIAKKAAYVILGLTCDGRKEVLSFAIGENESAKFWLNALNELKNRGVQDIMIICADGLAGIKEAITAAFPKTDCQRCMVRNTLKYVASKDMKSFAADLKTIYNIYRKDFTVSPAACVKVPQICSPFDFVVFAASFHLLLFLIEPKPLRKAFPFFPKSLLRLFRQSLFFFPASLQRARPQFWGSARI